MIKISFVIITVLFCCQALFAEDLQPSSSIDYQDITKLDTAVNADYLGRLEKEIILEMNKARSDPPKYAESQIKPMLKRFIGNKYYSNNKSYLTTEGKSAVQECLRYLHNAKPVNLLYPDKGLSMAAAEHVREQGKAGSIGHVGSDKSTPMSRVKKYAMHDYIFIGENISYGLTFAPEIVSFLLINDGMPSRKHREILMDTKVNLTGVSCGYHRVYGTMCVIVYGRLKKI